MTKEDTQISEAELVQVVLQDAAAYSLLVNRLHKFARRPWFRKMKSLQRPVTSADIQEYCNREGTYKTFTHDLFKQVVHEYLVKTKKGSDRQWFYLPSSSLDRQGPENVKVTATYAEFATPGGPFRFIFPDLITYGWENHSVAVRDIAKVRFELTSEDAISETLSKLGETRKQLEATNRLPAYVKEFIFGPHFDMVEDLVGVNLKIIVPQDCPLNHDALHRIPVSHGQVDQTVVQMFNQRLGLRDVRSRTPNI